MLSFGRFASRLASNALNFALLLLVVQETGKAFFSGLLVLALVLPATVAGMVAGTAADHLPRRLLVVAGNLVRAGVCVAFARGPQDALSCYLAAGGLAVATQFAANAEGAILPAIVARNDLARANAISHAIGGAAQLAGFGLLAPISLRVFHSATALFLAGAALFLLAAFYGVAIGRVIPPSGKEVGGERSGRWWLAGWHEMRSNPRVMKAALELTYISTALIVLGGLTPKYIEDVLGLPIDVGALILTPAAFGVAIGLRVAAPMARRVPHAAMSTAGFAFFALLLVALTFVNPLAGFLGGYPTFAWLNEVDVGAFDGGGVIAMAVALPLGFAYAIVSVAGQTVLNDSVPLRLQGRVQATQAAMAALAAALPALAASALSDALGVTPVMAAVAGATGAAAALSLRRPRPEVLAPAMRSR